MEKRHYSVQIQQRMEVCVLAADENEAEEIAREAQFEWVMADVEVESVEEAYNDEEDSEAIQDFKDEGKYATE